MYISCYDIYSRLRNHSGRPETGPFRDIFQILAYFRKQVYNSHNHANLRSLISKIDVMRPSIAVEDAVLTLGANIRNARLRRRLPQSVVAERAGVSLNTLSKVENGDCGVSIGNIASILNAVGLLPLLSSLASSENDDAGLLMEEKNLPRRIRQKKKPSLSS